MKYRKADNEEHENICKQIRSRSILCVSIMAPMIPLMILAAQ